MFPIDLVYTWVDGSEPQLAAEIERHWEQHCLKRFGQTHELIPKRFIEHSELKYSLRSVEKFAPWVRKIFVVTNGQVPPWLEIAHGKIELVTHEDIFPDTEALPTFSSMDIEMFLHRIPGLSEHFIAMNDDFMFGGPVTPDMFFTPDGRLQVSLTHEQWAGKPAPEGQYVFQAWNYSNELLSTVFPAACRKIPIHQARAVTKTMYSEIHDAFSAEIERSYQMKFRHPNNVAIPSFLAGWWALETGQGIQTHVDRRMILLEKDVESTTAQLEAAFAQGIPLVCLNENPRFYKPGTWETVIASLEALLPTPFAFEKTAALSTPYKPQ